MSESVIPWLFPYNSYDSLDWHLDDDVASVKFDLYYMVKLRNVRKHADMAIIIKIIIIMPITINRTHVETNEQKETQINVINYSPLDVRFKFLEFTI